MATYSGDVPTCKVILAHCKFDDLNMTGILTPLCVAALQGNTQIAQIYLSFERPNQHLFDCPSESIHGVCPMKLAQFRGDTKMIDLLRPKHKLHLYKTTSHS